jgi:hypothetical protein
MPKPFSQWTVTVGGLPLATRTGRSTRENDRSQQIPERVLRLAPFTAISEVSVPAARQGKSRHTHADRNYSSSPI